MRGIETAFFGTLGKDPELRTSKARKPWTAFSIAVTIGEDEDGRPLTQ
jgi:hypothetical protein